MAPKTTPQDVATDDTISGEVSTPRLAQQYHSFMRDRAEMESSGSSGEIMASQTERILSAQTEDEIWDADSQGTIQARDVPGLEVEVRGYRVNKSSRTDIENDKGYYITMDATVLGGPGEILVASGIKVGEDIALQTGADLITSKMRMFERAGLFPVRGLIAGTRTSSGQQVLRFKRLPVRSVQG